MTQKAPAATALACLRSIPFSKPDAVELINNLWIFAQFYASQRIHLNPPGSPGSPGSTGGQENSTSLAAQSSTAPTKDLQLPKFDINRTLYDIETKVLAAQYKGGFEFWTDVAMSFSGFRDEMTSFVLTCAGAFFGSHQLELVAVADSAAGRRDILLVDKSGSNVAGFGNRRNGTTNTKRSIGGIKLGKQVIKINGQDAETFLLGMATNMSDLWAITDPNTRWNALFNSFPDENPGYFAGRVGIWTDDKGNVYELEMEDGSIQKAEWQAEFGEFDPAFPRGEWNDTESFTRSVCYVSELEQKLRAPEIPGPLLRYDPSGDAYRRFIRAEIKKAADAVKHPNPRPASNKTITTATASSIEEDIPPAKYTPTPKNYPPFILHGSVDDNNQLLVYPDPDGDNSTAVISVGDFILNSGYNESTFDLLDSLWSFVFRNLTARGTKRLIMDISGNRGGELELAFRLSQHLFPETFTSPDQIKYGYNLRWTPMLAKLFRTPVKGSAKDTRFSVGRSQMFGIESDGKSTVTSTTASTINSTTDEFLGPYYYPEVKDYFTALKRYNLTWPGTDVGNINLPKKNVWEPQDVVVVGDGYCVGSCWMFVHLMELAGVRVYAQGGRSERKTMPAIAGYGKSAAGYSYDAMVADMFKAFGDTSDNKDMLKHPRTRLDASFTRMGFGQNWIVDPQDPRRGKGIPAGFEYKLACKKIPFTEFSILDIEERWRVVKKTAWKYGKSTACDREEEEGIKLDGAKVFEEEQGILDGAEVFVMGRNETMKVVGGKPDGGRGRRRKRL
ncbi:Similar to peptidase S41 family protein [Pyrenophora tritici-repentis Pt-1C-BFP]; acc. no. XP_001934373 [Pyronema omphalodes CBS 100304]|uniref:Similar to peptidase S41 family protein [Pyrenophora tritici-repentis Pt-1C-BFP] acc. no. XP_001934373 n=1 Tax=Pyronema omphalodes (strain CBS 100304) TaxID=1076935 RepID=U4LUJ7_PYROM|nr:Similar to peptidase S41 family protein [Pyrenophora tritici-repentis Pt-1C-BFP]; acc. no. XP_001934373 [Pyronema omphalodes CBS 100304]